MRELRLTILGFVALALPAAATGSVREAQQFTDEAGDSFSAPDIGTVAVRVDPSTARLEFAISTPNRLELPSEEAVFVYVDLDPDRTPAVGRLDYELIISRTYICRRGGSCTREPGFSYATGGGRTTLTFRPSSATPVDFRVVTVHAEGGRSFVDSAPDPGTSRRARHWRLRRAVFTQACVVPDVRRMRLLAARRAIVRAHCTVGRVARNKSRTGAGRVLRQAPRPRALLPLRGRVDLVVGSPRS